MWYIIYKIVIVIHLDYRPSLKVHCVEDVCFTSRAIDSYTQSAERSILVAPHCQKDTYTVYTAIIIVLDLYRLL